MQHLLVRVVLGVTLLTSSTLASCARPRGGLVTPAGVAVNRPRLEVTAQLEARAGSVRGFVQTPKGGVPGTSTPRRPTFDEVGVEAAYAPAAEVSLAYRHHRVRVGAALWMLHGDEVLGQQLVSQEVTYPAGTRLTSSTELLTSHLSYGYALDLSRGRGTVELTPALGVYQYGLRYDVAGGGLASSRSFNSFSPMFESALVWRPGGRVHVSADLRLVLDEALGLSSPTNVVEGSVRLHLDLWRKGDVFFSVGATHVDHRDEQELPNDAEFDILPWFGFGGEVRF